MARRCGGSESELAPDSASVTVSLVVLVVGLIYDDGWEPPDDEPEPPRSSRKWDLPWRPLVWVAVWCWLMALVPVVSTAFGGLAGFGVLMAALALAVWRIDRWCAKQYWAGLREYKM
jgi:hypothetical protein